MEAQTLEQGSMQKFEPVLDLQAARDAVALASHDGSLSYSHGLRRLQQTARFIGCAVEWIASQPDDTDFFLECSEVNGDWTTAMICQRITDELPDQIDDEITPDDSAELRHSILCIVIPLLLELLRR